MTGSADARLPERKGACPMMGRMDDLETRVRASFARQQAMATMGVTLARVAPGEGQLAPPYPQRAPPPPGPPPPGLGPWVTRSVQRRAAMASPTALVERGVRPRSARSAATARSTRSASPVRPRWASSIPTDRIVAGGSALAS